MNKTIILTIVLFVFLITSCEEEEASELNQPFTSEWINIDPDTPDITRVSFDVGSDSLSVEMWGACIPDDCDWGVVAATIANAADGKLDLHWDHGFSTKDQTLEINEMGQLVVSTYTIFKDNSGRGNRSYVNIFQRYAGN